MIHSLQTKLISRFMASFSGSRYYLLTVFFLFLFFKTVNADSRPLFGFENFSEGLRFESQFDLFGDAQLVKPSVSLQLSGSVVSSGGKRPANERKQPAKIVELETQLAQLQEELKRAKDQLSSSESLKKMAEQDAEEVKKQVAATSIRLEESEKQLDEVSDLEGSRLQELRRLSQERDRAWKSELEAVRKQHSFDSSALASAMNEIQRLKNQLNLVAESKAAHAKDTESAQVDIQNLRCELTRTFELVENLKSQLSESRESKTSAVEEMNSLVFWKETQKD